MAFPKKTSVFLVFALTVAVGARFVLSGYRVAAYALICGVFIVLLGWTLSENRM